MKVIRMKSTPSRSMLRRPSCYPLALWPKPQNVYVQTPERCIIGWKIEEPQTVVEVEFNGG